MLHKAFRKTPFHDRDRSQVGKISIFVTGGNAKQSSELLLWPDKWSLSPSPADYAVSNRIRM